MLINIFLALAFIFDILLGLSIIIKSSKREDFVAFAVSSICVGLWTFGILMFRLVADLRDTLFWNREFIFTAGLIASTFLHFALVFTRTRVSLLTKVLLHIPNLFILAGVYIPGALIKQIIIREWGKESILGDFYYLFGIYFSVYIIYALYKLFVSARKSSGILKTQSQYIFLATLLTSIVGTYFNLYLILLGNYRYVWVGPYNSFFLVLIVAFAITKTRLMDISVVISKTLSHVLTIVFLGAIYLIGALAYWNFVAHSIVWLLTLTIIYGIFVGEFFQNIRLRVQTTADKLILRGRYNYYQVLREAGVRIFACTEVKELLAVLYDIFFNAVEIKSPRIFLTNAHDEFLAWDPKTAAPIEGGDEIAQDELLVRHLFEKRTYLLKENLKQTLKEKDIAQNLKENLEKIMQRMEGLDAALVIPCLTRDKMLGVFVLGPKLSEDPYTSDDLELLFTIATQTAAVIERVRAYSDMKESLKSAMAAAEESARLASLGSLARGVAHEINNPMGVISGNVQLITQNLDTLRKTPEKLIEAIERYLNPIPDEIDRISRMSSKILSISKAPKELEISRVNINENLANTVLVLRGEAKKKQIIINEDYGAIPEIEADADKLSQVFFNLILNAVQSMERPGKINIRTTLLRVPQAESNLPLEKVQIEIKDEGPGIPAEKLDKIFTPFYTTKDREFGQGTGLGLSISRRIVENHRGEIRAESKVGEGTAFIITLPIAQ